jgi:hypothetical protein
MFENADLIHCYSRADALRDGVLLRYPQPLADHLIAWSLPWDSRSH